MMEILARNSKISMKLQMLSKERMSLKEKLKLMKARLSLDHWTPPNMKAKLSPSNLKFEAVFFN